MMVEISTWQNLRQKNPRPQALEYLGANDNGAYSALQLLLRVSQLDKRDIRPKN
jgi:hypothetical protein